MKRRLMVEPGPPDDCGKPNPKVPRKKAAASVKLVPADTAPGPSVHSRKTARRTGPAAAEQFERKKYLVQVGHCIHRVIQLLLRRLAFQVVEHLRDRHTPLSAHLRA